MNELYEKIATASDEELMNTIKTAIDEIVPYDPEATLDEIREGLENERREALKQIAAIDRLISIVHRYREEAEG